MSDRRKALIVLSLNTLAFTVCFAVWMLNGVLVTYLVENRVFLFDKVQIGTLLGIPVLTGSIVRLPVGVLTDRYGGKWVFPGVLLAAALGTFYLAHAHTYGDFVVASLIFGLAGTGFAVGIAYTSVWFPKSQQGTALGIFGVGNAGAAVTTLGGPSLLGTLTQQGANPEGWRTLPYIYTAALVGMAIVFTLMAFPKKPAVATQRSISAQLATLKIVRVWRFGLYYFLVFGGFVALAQWLVPYYVSVYGTTVVLAGLLTSIFSLPSGVIRALGGWMSDVLGARSTMYWVLGSCVLCCALLSVPRMEITSPGESVMAARKGRVTSVSPTEIVVDGQRYVVHPRANSPIRDDQTLILPTSQFGQEPVVAPGDMVTKKQVLARGTTHIFFQANIWVFTALLFVLGVMMGIGKAAVYKHIPEYFPDDVGVVGGMVGMIGGLGGFFCPILFGYLLRGTGLWTTTWMFLFVLSVLCLVWMHVVVRQLMNRHAPDFAEKLDDVSRAKSKPSHA